SAAKCKKRSPRCLTKRPPHTRCHQASKSDKRSDVATPRQSAQARGKRGASFRSPELPLQSARTHHEVRAAPLALLWLNLCRSIFALRPAPAVLGAEAPAAGLRGVTSEAKSQHPANRHKPEASEELHFAHRNSRFRARGPITK